MIGAFGMAALHAQQGGIKRSLLMKHELSAPGRAHQTKALDKKPTRVLAVYIVEKDKPFVAPPSQ